MNQMNIFYQSLWVMGWGMAGIFVVVTVFYAMIILLSKLLPEKKEAEDN